MCLFSLIRLVRPWLPLKVLRKLADFGISGICDFRVLRCVFKQVDFCLVSGFDSFRILKSWQNFEFLKNENPAPVRSWAGILLLIIKTYKWY